MLTANIEVPELCNIPEVQTQRRQKLLK